MIYFLWYCDIGSDFMESVILDEKYHVNNNTQFLLRYVRSDTERFVNHSHNYYELFMIIKGNVCHTVNGEDQILRRGHLLFIRDFDTHNYKSADGEYFEFMNLAFSKKVMNDLLSYLGDGFNAKPLTEAHYPPCVLLNEKDSEKLFYEFTLLGGNENDLFSKMKMRCLLLKIFTTYFLGYKDFKSDIPLWLEMAYEKIKNPSNFIYGAKRLCEITGKSREHIARCMQKYYHISPSELITNLRLDYCANLLISSNLSVTDICFESGFENLSWFYKIFVRRFSLTPTQYRKKYT